jgi:type I restriction enzyme S subunit
MKISFISDAQDHITEYAVRSGAAALIPVGTLLFVVRGMILARSFPVALTTREVTFNQDMRSLTPCNEVHASYLLRVLQHEALHILFAVKEATHGTLRLESSILRQWPIPLPPLDEQGRIVGALDVFLTEINATRERLRRVTGVLGAIGLAEQRDGVIGHADKLTQAILAKAFRGDLVPTEAELARREGRDYEPASALIERIRREREATNKRNVKRPVPAKRNDRMPKHPAPPTQRRGFAGRPRRRRHQRRPASR